MLALAEETQYRWFCQYCCKTFAPRRIPDMSKNRWIELFSAKHLKVCNSIEHENSVRLLHQYQCPLCGKEFNSSSMKSPKTLDSKFEYYHMKQCHPEEFKRRMQIEDLIFNSQRYANKIDESNWSWCCPICQKTHFSKSQYSIKNPVEWAHAIAVKHVEKCHSESINKLNV